MGSTRKRRNGTAAATGSALERSSPVPLYHQLALKLKKDLLEGSLKPETRYYSDRELISTYGVSLLTARQAMSQLTNDGLLERRQGSGTFVSSLVATLREKARTVRREAVLFSGWSPAALSGWESMYFRDIFKGMKEECDARRLDILFDDPDTSSPEALAADVSRRGIRGVLMLLGSDVRKRLRVFRQMGLKAVAVNFEFPGIPCVMPNDYAGGRLAVAHLLVAGHRRLIHVNSGEKERHWTEVRRAYEDCIAAAGLSLAENPVLLGSRNAGTIQAGYEVAPQVFDRASRPSAIFCGNDLMATGVMRYMSEHSIRAPDEISVVGFDNIEAAEICSPPLTTIAVDRVGLGKRAVQLLFSSPPPESTQQIDVQLIVRESTAPAVQPSARTALTS